MKRFMLIILAVSTVLVSGVSCSKEDPQQKLPEGALPGEFSISATKKVHFSQGNLVATIDASGVPVAWKFATKQHDYLGEGGANGTIGTAAGDVDLFCWSTDAASNNWGIYTQTEITESVTNGNFNDWGKNIGNGNVWRTLSTEEWQYLFSYDGSEHGGIDYDNDTRRGKYKNGVTVCGKEYCVVLLPDNWDTSLISLDTFASTTEYNEETTVKWSAMEAAGAVCLPAAGYRKGLFMCAVDDLGNYWTSSAYDDEEYAFSESFLGDIIYADDYDLRHLGFNVRLITDVK